MYDTLIDFPISRCEVQNHLYLSQPAIVVFQRFRSVENWMSFHQERHLYLALTKSELSITDSQAPGDMALELPDVTGLKEKGKSDGSLRDEIWRVSSAKLI